MRSGLEVFVEEYAERYRGARIGLCCNPTAVDRTYIHAIDLLQSKGLQLKRLFGPEHGISATAQDMIGVTDGDGGVAPGVETVSLYGDTAESLRPPASSLADLDLLLFDVQDIGSRYYTFQATLGYIMEVAATTGTPVVVLDRPNPINGVALEGNLVRKGYESFVSAYNLPNRHGMTMGELAAYFRRVVGIQANVEIIRCEGWDRATWLDQTPLPWVIPSPNMPTLETAAIYPGMCLIEGTNLSEGRGTTRPFHFVGAPWLRPGRFAELCRKGAFDAGLEGVAFRPIEFFPQFQKHAKMTCGGVEIHVTDRDAMEPLLLGLVVLEAARRADPERFAWRTEVYEFVKEPIAIDLLCGSAEARLGIEAGVSPRELVNGWLPELEEWKPLREACLLY